MPNSFDATNPPFDRLSEHEIDSMRDAIDIGYFKIIFTMFLFAFKMHVPIGSVWTPLNIFKIAYLL